MKPTEIRPINRLESSGAPRPDRLTPLLIAAAVLLVIILVLLSADLWLRPVSGGQVARAVGPSQSVPTVAPTSIPPTTAPSAPVVAEGSPNESGDADLTAAVTPAPCVPPSDWGVYPVQQGNTLYSLAQRYNTDVEALMRVNCLNTTTIFVGQRLYVPGLPAVAQAAPTGFADEPAAPANMPQPGASATPIVGSAAAPLPTLTPMPAFPISIP
ncbi:MAG: LysM peptidoglycan-binding domain-containing protein, partial [Anaerolineae bacterium]|nr:LysM peptidoglycan-binding domain-containing protein [Anaerolineae bacterium]